LTNGKLTNKRTETNNSKSSDMKNDFKKNLQILENTLNSTCNEQNSISLIHNTNRLEENSFILENPGKTDLSFSNGKIRHQNILSGLSQDNITEEKMYPRPKLFLEELKEESDTYTNVDCSEMSGSQNPEYF